MFSLMKRRPREKLSECLKILKGFTNVEEFKMLYGMTVHNLSKNINSDCTNFFLPNVVVREWNKLPSSAVYYTTID